MKIDVPGCAVVGWLYALSQEWPSARGRPSGGLIVHRQSTDSDVRPDDVLRT
jgi:hypothetical protein